MSRMILAVCSLVVLSGCQSFSVSGASPLTGPRIQTVACDGDYGCDANGGNGACDDCVPHRTFAVMYCPLWDNLVTRHTAHRCAVHALSSYQAECGQSVSHHFRRGFITAYVDLAMNRQPRPRIVPPPKYWNAYYRSCAGQAYVDEWFAGYDAGLDQGSNSGVSRFHEVYLRRNCGGQQANRYGDAQAGPVGVAPQQPLYPQQQSLYPQPISTPNMDGYLNPTQ